VTTKGTIIQKRNKRLNGKELEPEEGVIASNQGLISESKSSRAL
jgi:hypothetical protein